MKTTFWILGVAGLAISLLWWVMPVPRIPDVSLANVRSWYGAQTPFSLLLGLVMGTVTGLWARLGARYVPGKAMRHVADRVTRFGVLGIVATLVIATAAWSIIAFFASQFPVDRSERVSDLVFSGLFVARVLGPGAVTMAATHFCWTKLGRPWGGSYALQGGYAENKET